MDAERTVAPAVCRFCRNWLCSEMEMPGWVGICRLNHDVRDEEDSCEAFERREER